MAQMRRADRALAADEAERILETGVYGVISSVDESGEPYGVPTCYVWDGDGVIIHGATQGTKISSLDSCGRATFCVVGQTCGQSRQFAIDYESAIISGHAEELSGAEKERALMAFVRKYSPDYLETGSTYIDHAKDRVRLFKIRAERISGKARRPKGDAR